MAGTQFCSLVGQKARVVVLLGLGAGAFLVEQWPSFWREFGVRLGKALLPRTVKYLARRMPPEE